MLFALILLFFVVGLLKWITETVENEKKSKR